MHVKYLQQINKSRWLKYVHFKNISSTSCTFPPRICQTARTCTGLQDLSPRVYLLWKQKFPFNTHWGQHSLRTKCFHLFLEHECTSSRISCSISLQTIYQHRHVLSFIVVKHNSRDKHVKQDWNISRFWLEIRHIWQIYLGR